MQEHSALFFKLDWSEFEPLQENKENKTKNEKL